MIHALKTPINPAKVTEVVQNIRNSCLFSASFIREQVKITSSGEVESVLKFQWGVFIANQRVRDIKDKLAPGEIIPEPH